IKSIDNSFYSFNFGVPTDYTCPGDFDGDGKFTACVQRPGANAQAPATFYVQNSDGGISTIPFGLSNDLIVPGDYDGDTKTDLAVVREGATDTTPLLWSIRRSSDGQIVQKQWGFTGGDLLTQNDYDGDGKTDIAVWRNSDGRFYVNTSRNDSISVTHWGQAGDFPVGSYDTH
ncbi:MAG: copper oxidase, partial [Acidobacteria bacterium]|nr:copper oxidase [Acidobacteriota bacterium]